MADHEGRQGQSDTAPALRSVPLPPAATDAIELLNADICFTGWEHSIAGQKSYYVRGATWFHNHVMRPISDLQKRPVEDFAAVFARLPRFRELKLDWDEKFSPRQAMAALSLRQRKPVKFHKAVQTILLCDQITNERVASGEATVALDEALRRMRIEPAVFYIQDFDAEQLEELKAKEAKILERLRSITGQRTRAVFNDMASGHTVTKRLADLTQNALVSLFPDAEIGAVDCGIRHHVALGSALTEALSD